MGIDFENCTPEELWKYVGEHLSKNGLDAVLVGGAVVSVYTDGIYQSGDLDFIIQNLAKEKLPTLMKEVGFEKHGRHYIHPECGHLFVEFPPGPLEIGEETNIRSESIESNGAIIKILSPTDCIKDRLANYIYFKSQEGMDQALLVAKLQPFNKSLVEKWCIEENHGHVFGEFLTLFKKSQKKGGRPQ